MTDLHAYVAARVLEDGDCLRWTGYLEGGYPAGTIGGRNVLIRRELWRARHGPIPAGHVVRCTCGTPRCVAVEHIELTTYRSIAIECGSRGAMSGPKRSARIAAVKRTGPQAKITQADARSIRVSHEPLRVLSARYGISEAMVSRIKRGQCRREFGDALARMAMELAS